MTNNRYFPDDFEPDCENAAHRCSYCGYCGKYDNEETEDERRNDND